MFRCVCRPVCLSVCLNHRVLLLQTQCSAPARFCFSHVWNAFSSSGKLTLLTLTHLRLHQCLCVEPSPRIVTSLHSPRCPPYSGQLPHQNLPHPCTGVPSTPRPQPPHTRASCPLILSSSWVLMLYPKLFSRKSLFTLVISFPTQVDSDIRSGYPSMLLPFF